MIGYLVESPIQRPVITCQYKPLDILGWKKRETINIFTMNSALFLQVPSRCIFSSHTPRPCSKNPKKH